MNNGLFGFLHDEIVADTQKAVNTDFFASDFQMKRNDGVCRITIVSQGASVFKLVPNTGSAISLKAGAAMTANAHYVEDVALDTGRTWNIQNSTGTTTVSMLRVQELAQVT